MGATGCTPKNLESTSEANASQRARDDAFRRLEEAYPRKGLGLTDPAMARRAFADLIASGVEVEALVGAALLYGADPVLTRLNSALVGLHRWLADGRYRGWLPDERPGAPPSGEARNGFAGPPALRAAIVAAEGDAFARSYLDRGAWDGATGTLTPATVEAFKRLTGKAAHLFEEHGATLGAPMGATG